MLSFRTPQLFRAWLKKNHGRAPELILRCFKKHAREQGITHPQALDEALCFGWIDGVVRRVDADSYSVRFSPRRPKSKWSVVNQRHFARLKAAGLVHPAGEAAFRARDQKADAYSFERKRVAFDRASLEMLKANSKAWAFFKAQPPGYQRIITFFVMSGKREETRKKRLGVLISHCVAGKRIPLM